MLLVSALIGLALTQSLLILGLLTLIASVGARPPFVPVPAEILPDIVRALEIRPGLVVCDLGCGDARVLAACSRAEPRASYVGVEKGIYPWLAAVMQSWKFGRTGNISVRRQNFFETDLAGFDRLFLYLYPDVNARLLPKLKKELGPGSLVVTCDFDFPGLRADSIIDLPGRSLERRGKRLLVYRF